jgi:hypothetical protein
MTTTRSWALIRVQLADVLLLFYVREPWPRSISALSRRSEHAPWSKMADH